ncbi:MAG: GNAT family N-acetyltransferase [Dysgonomonas sp.]|nr:GNAT family N-acetyltransferase [Dysgonomonas sp.]
MEIEIKKYSPDRKKEWDDFVSSSKNGTFLFYRDFMEYHSNRFTDCSLLFYHKEKLLALLPANIADRILHSHQGLTYGGLIMGISATTKIVLDIFECLIKYLQENKIHRLIYKAVPHIYHKISAEEDLYALYQNKAILAGRSISSCIVQQNKLKYSELRKRGIKKAQANHLQVGKSSNFRKFWQILEENLSQRFSVSPVHTISEISYLKEMFPDNIRLFQVNDSNEEIVAGCVVFETDRVVHIQYISASAKGKETGALDFLFDHLITNIYQDKPYFEFGISTENNGAYLNEGLISQKEGFGGRGIVYDMYRLDF